MLTSRSLSFVLVAVLGCSSDPEPTPDAPTLRPGVVDSSHAYQGTPNAHESAFWSAILEASDERRAAAVAQLKTDVQTDTTNGYSAFLIGASSFMPPRAALEALANGTAPAPFGPSGEAVPYFEQGLANLTDPLYLGFDGMLLASLLFAVNDPRAPSILATAFQNNPVASAFGAIVGDLFGGAGAAGLDHMHQLFDTCLGGAIARDGSDAGMLASKMNAGTLQHRECFSGYYGPHGSSGMLLIAGDLQAINGHPDAAQRYYAAAKTTSDYATWALAPVVERRVVAGAAAPAPEEVAAIAGTCGTCHVRSLR